MKKKIPTLLFVTCLFIILVYTNKQNNSVYSSTAGAPAGNTGSPSDGFSCARSGCHSGSATSQSGLITSNIPVTGYVPGTTYTITASITTASIVKFGFQVSPQSSTGQPRGTIIVTNSTTTQILNGSGGKKYITHKSTGTSGSGSKTWSFDWTAPAIGSGAVTFYGAFNSTNNQNNSIGDLITLSQLTVNEESGVGMDELLFYSYIKVFPNPSTNNIKINGHFLTGKSLGVSVMNINGQVVLTKSFSSIEEPSLSVSELSEGLYIVKVQTPEKSYVTKFVKAD